MGKPELPVPIFPLFRVLIWSIVIRAQLDAPLKLLLRKLVWLERGRILFFYMGEVGGKLWGL